MKNFYFLIKIVSNPVSNDAISIGLVVISFAKLMVRFSPHQIRLAKSLLSGEGAIINFIEKQITARIEEQNQLLEQESKSNTVFKLESFIKSEYIDYLNVYSNNLLHFSKPVVIDSPIDDNKFEELFTLMISRKDLQPKLMVPVEDDFFIKIAEKLIEKVKDKVHTNYHFNPKVLPSLYFKFDMDCIGLNGVFTGAKSIDFSRSSRQTIDHQISHYFTVTTLLERKFQRHRKENNFYLIADEPKKTFSTEHALWKSVRIQDKIKVIPSDEADIVVEKIEETGAKEFL